MRLQRVLIGAVFLAAGTQAWQHLTEEEVMAVESSNESGTEQPRCQLIAYTHPEDEASQALEAEWSKLKELATLGTTSASAGTISSIDCTKSPFFKQLCQDARVKSFPTIRLYREDSSRDYDRYRGAHKASDIMAFLRRSLGPTIFIVGEKNITDFTASDHVIFLGSFPASDETSRAENLFRDVAARYRDRFSFGLLKVELNNNKEAKSKVMCWNNLDDEKHETSTSTSTTTQLETREMLEAFIRLCYTPVIPEMTRRNELSFYETRKSIVHYFTRNAQEREEYVKEMRPLAKKYKEYLHFTTTDVNEYPDAPEMMGLEWGSSKGLSVQNPNNGHVYPYRGTSQALSASVVELFLSEIIQGKVKPLRGGTNDEDSSSGNDEKMIRREHEEL